MPQVPVRHDVPLLVRPSMWLFATYDVLHPLYAGIVAGFPRPLESHGFFLDNSGTREFTENHLVLESL